MAAIADWATLIAVRPDRQSGRARNSVKARLGRPPAWDGRPKGKSVNIAPRQHPAPCCACPTCPNHADTAIRHRAWSTWSSGLHADHHYP